MVQDFLSITSFIFAQCLEPGATPLDSCRNPHSQSWCFLPALPTIHLDWVDSLHELLCLLVEWRTLLDGGKALDLQGSARLLDGNNPRVGLSARTHLLAHDLARLVPGEVLGCQATHGLCLASTQHHRFGHPALRDLAQSMRRRSCLWSSPTLRSPRPRPRRPSRF